MSWYHPADLGFAVRRKLADSGADPIASVYGVGYRFETTDQVQPA